eukprot:TRINITY_DN28650_c0_g1_i1.p1 TRINITY_DN28650_c0_g1~~TRINITY_DN28650_c0_g1_i1.p1  ORF type:complete len:292 (+),score=68.34 TRINITY_DN28650_c0_g1_i1:61-936(+)
MSRVSSVASSRRSSIVSGESLLSARSTASTSTTDSWLPSKTPRVRKGSLGAVASRNLREFSQARRLVPQEFHNEPDIIPSMEELQLDLQGGNGPWKKKRAGTLIKERLNLQMADELERKLAEQEKLRKIAEKQEWLRRAKEQEQLELQKDKERIQARERQVKAACSWQSLMRRVVEEEERLMSRLREPTVCEICSGSGRCQCCKGQGTLSTMYLSPAVNVGSVSARFHGRSAYGCNECGGFRDGSDCMGKDVQHRGSGNCATCGGHGKIWPTLADVLERRKQELSKRSADD